MLADLKRQDARKKPGRLHNDEAWPGAEAKPYDRACPK